MVVAFAIALSVMKVAARTSIDRFNIGNGRLCRSNKVERITVARGALIRHVSDRDRICPRGEVQVLVPLAEIDFDTADVRCQRQRIVRNWIRVHSVKCIDLFDIQCAKRIRPPTSKSVSFPPRRSIAIPETVPRSQRSYRDRCRSDARSQPPRTTAPGAEIECIVASYEIDDEVVIGSS